MITKEHFSVILDSPLALLAIAQIPHNVESSHELAWRFRGGGDPRVKWAKPLLNHIPYRFNKFVFVAMRVAS